MFVCINRAISRPKIKSTKGFGAKKDLVKVLSEKTAKTNGRDNQPEGIQQQRT
jgi:hypothetical protein